LKGLIIKEWYCQKTGMWMSWFWAVISLFLAFSGETSLIYVAMLAWVFNTAPITSSYTGERTKEYRETYEVLAVSKGDILSAKYAVQSFGLIFACLLFGAVVGLNRLFSVNVIHVDELKVFMTIVLIGVMYQSVVATLLLGKSFIVNILASLPPVAVSIIFLSFSWGEHYSFNLSGWAIGALFAVTVAVYLLCWKIAVKKVSK